MSVLVAYATAHGSTRGVAERIASVLRRADVDAVLINFDQVPTAAHFDAFILGSAVHNQGWLSPALEYVDLNYLRLSTCPTWLFSVGMPGAVGRHFRKTAMREARAITAPILKKLQPRDHRLFTGVIREEDMSTIGRVIFRASGGRFGDFRDWTEIEIWAEQIAAVLKAQTAKASVELPVC